MTERRQVFKRESAGRDLDQCASYLQLGAGLDVALRFLERAEEAFAFLLEHPHAGRPWQLADPALEGIRSWRVSGFDDYLIFYRSVSNGVEIVHVTHGAQDLKRIFPSTS